MYSCLTGKNFRAEVGGLKEIAIIGSDKKKEVVGNMAKFKEIKKYLRVLARSSPEDKLILVTGM